MIVNHDNGPNNDASYQNIVEALTKFLTRAKADQRGHLMGLHIFLLVFVLSFNCNCIRLINLHTIIFDNFVIATGQ
jgi:hypothetical protein